MDALEHRARVPVMLHSPRRGQLVIQRVTYQDVREAQAGGVARDVPNDTFRHCFVQCVIQRLVRVATEVSERVDFELSPKHRSKRQEPPTRLGESRDAAADDFADPRWDLEFFRTGAKSGLRNEQAHDLAHEERVSRGLGVDLRDRTASGSTLATIEMYSATSSWARPSRVMRRVTGSRTSSERVVRSGSRTFGSTSR